MRFLRTGSIRTRLLLAFLAVAVISAGALSLLFLSELEAYGLRKLEERLASEARLTAAFVEASYDAGGDVRPGGVLGRERVTEALQGIQPFVPSRIRVLDAEGELVADSRSGGESGFGDRPEVRRALDGEYGAYTRVTSDQRVALYVAVPIALDGRVHGVAYSSASTFSILTLLRDYRLRLAGLVALFAAATLLLTEMLSRWLARPLRSLETAAASFTTGKYAARATPQGSRETRAVAEAFNKMADEVERIVTELQAEERTKSHFVSDVSHELRTPLTAIRGAAETLLDGDVPEDDEKRFLATIVRESDRLSRLANDLLTLQRMEGATGELPLRRLDLLHVAQAGADALDPLTEAREVAVTVEGESADVLGDPDRLQQVVANLVDNATRHTPAGRSVQVRVSRSGKHAVLTVTDDGPGIPEDHLPRVFDRFYRSQSSRDRSTGGAGLGLAIVRAIVIAHAGTIEVENVPEGGARFTVCLPLLRADSGTATVA